MSPGSCGGQTVHERWARDALAPLEPRSLPTKTRSHHEETVAKLIYSMITSLDGYAEAAE